MTRLSFPWLTSAIVLTLLIGVLLARVSDPSRARRLAVGAAAALALLGVGATILVHGASADTRWIDPVELAILGAPRPVLALDPLNAPLLAYAAIVVLAVMAGTPRVAFEPTRASAAIIHLAATWTLFLTLDLGLFTAAYVLALVPALPSTQHHRGPSARRLYLLYLFGSATMIAVAIASVGYAAMRAGVAAPLSLVDLSASTVELRPPWIALPLLLVGVVLRKGAFPFHSWIPALSERLGPLSLILLTAPQIGAFVLVRIGIPLFPEQLAEALPVVARIALVASVYGAALGLVAKTLRRAFGWLVVSQSALVLVGLECTTPDGMAGGLTLWLSVGLALTGLALAIGAVEARIGQRSLESYAGLATRAPRLAATFLILGFASVGLPGTLGFVAEDLLVHGALASYPGIGAAIVVATGCNGFTILRAFTRTFYGPAPSSLAVGDLLPRERLALVGLVVLLVAGGILAGPVVRTREPVAAHLIDRLVGPATSSGGHAP